MPSRVFLGEFEQMVLLAILQLGDDAFGPGISQELEKRAGRRVSRGALYATLERLDRKDLLRWEIEAATSDRGGNRRRRFQITPAGIEAMATAREAWVNLMDGLDSVLKRS